MPGVSTRNTVLLNPTPAGRLNEGALHSVLGYQLAQATVVADAVFDTQVAGVHDLRKVEYTTLALVEQNEGLTAAQLAAALAFTAPNMAAWIERLVKRGLIEREPHARDRRAMHIRLTKAGRTLVRQATEAISQGEAAAFAGMSLAERLMLVELLHKAAACRPGR